MTKKKVKKVNKNSNPFVGLTLEEVVYYESTVYVIQIGVDFFKDEDGFYFSKKQAGVVYKSLLDGLLDGINNGTEESKRLALKCLARLSILPLRIQ